MLFRSLVWLVINDFYDEHGHIYFSATNLKIPTSDLHLIIGDLRAFLATGKELESTSLDVYKRTNKFTSVMLIINLGVTSSDQDKDGKPIMFDDCNVFSYGDKRRNLVVSTDRVSHSNWGQVITHGYEGIEGLFNCLIELINRHQQIGRAHV